MSDQDPLLGWCCVGGFRKSCRCDAHTRPIASEGVIVFASVVSLDEALLLQDVDNGSGLCILICSGVIIVRVSLAPDGCPGILELLEYSWYVVRDAACFLSMSVTSRHAVRPDLVS
jgi:hypothetical protein